jgi:hypothetical protein
VNVPEEGVELKTESALASRLRHRNVEVSTLTLHDLGVLQYRE